MRVHACVLFINVGYTFRNCLKFEIMPKIKPFTPALKGDCFLPDVRRGFFGLPRTLKGARKIKMSEI